MTDLSQIHAQLQSESAQGRLPLATKTIIRIIREAKRKAAEDAEEILDSWMRYAEFDSRAEALTWLGQLADDVTRIGLMAKASEIADEHLREIWMRRFDAPAYLHRFTNRKAVEATVEMAMYETATKIKDAVSPMLEKVITESAGQAMFSIQKEVRVGWDFTLPNKKQLTAYLREHDVEYIGRTLAHSAESQTDKIIIEGILSGRSLPKMAKEVAEVTDADYFAVKRNIRTELTRCANEGETYAMQKAGINRYEYRCVFDERTCPVCGALNGKTFDIDDREEGVNYPPMHPHCRCMHLAAVTDEVRATLTRSARDSNGKTITVPASMTYEEWADQFLT